MPIYFLQSSLSDNVGFSVVYAHFGGGHLKGARNITPGTLSIFDFPEKFPNFRKVKPTTY